MLRVVYYGDDHATRKEIENVTHINFYCGEGIACVFYRNAFGVQILEDISTNELITVEEV